MWDQSSGSQFGQIIQSLMQQNPQVYQRMMQLMSQQRTAGIGSLQPRQGGGPMPMPLGGTQLERFGRGTDPGGSNLLGVYDPEAQKRAAYNGPPITSGPMPQGGMWGMQRPPMQQPMGAGDGSAWGPNAAGQRALMPPPTYGGSGFQGTGPTMPYGQRFNTSPQPYTTPTPMPTADRPAAPYRAPAYTPAPFSAPTPQPKTYGAPAPAGPGLAQNGTSGLDWYAMQAGN